jgi:hypothetical protein
VRLVARLYARALGLVGETTAGGVPVLIVSRLIPSWAVGQAIGDTVLVVKGYENDAGIIAHELVHVAQYRRLGVAFIGAYFLEYLKHGYEFNRFEREARGESRPP